MTLDDLLARLEGETGGRYGQKGEAVWQGETPLYPDCEAGACPEAGVTGISRSGSVPATFGIGSLINARLK